MKIAFVLGLTAAASAGAADKQDPKTLAPPPAQTRPKVVDQGAVKQRRGGAAKAGVKRAQPKYLLTLPNAKPVSPSVKLKLKQSPGSTQPKNPR